MAAVITITNKGTDYYVTVNGRATFEHAPQLRSLAKTLENAAYTSINVDLGQCTGMDSTFMGILSMLGLNARKIGVTMTYFIPKNVTPSEIEIVAEGYGGQGVAYVSVKTDKGTYVPKGLLSVTGEVWRADHMLAADATFAYLGFQKTLDAFLDRTKAYLKSSVRIALEKQK